MTPQRRTRTSFVSKDGEPFNHRLNVRFQSFDIEEVDRLRKPGESLADFVRAAVREKILRDGGVAGYLLGVETER